jgi:hypothetical protein
MLTCRDCGAYVKSASSKDVVEIVCWQCVFENYVEQPKLPKKSSGKPRGWMFMNQYVHSDGTVFNKGIEQPNLKGQLPPTSITTTKKKKKTQQEMQDINAAIGQLKKKLKSASTKKAAAVIEKQIKKLIKQL